MKGEVEAVANEKIIPLLREQCVPVCLQPLFALDNIRWKCVVTSLHSLLRGSLGALVNDS